MKISHLVTQSGIQYLIKSIVYLLFFTVFFSNKIYPQSRLDSLLTMNAQEFLSSEKLKTSIDVEKFDTDLFNAILFHMTNQVREKNRLINLRYDSVLYNAAFLHTNQMIKKRFISHKNPYSSKYQSLKDRVFLCGANWSEYKRFGENLIYISLMRISKYKKSYRVVKENDTYKYFFYDKHQKKEIELSSYSYFDLCSKVLEVWMNSRKHRRNIMHTKYTSLGCYGDVDSRSLYSKKSLPMIKVTQVFGQDR